MASTYGGIVVKANGLTLVVDITNRDTGTRPTVYSARNGTSTVALPATITTDTGVVLPSGSLERPFGKYNLLDGKGRIVATGDAGHAPLTVA